MVFHPFFYIFLDESAKINGSYLRGTNRIVIYRNAEGGVLLRTAAHEVYHFIEQWSPENAAKLRDYTFKALKESGVDIEQALKKYESYSIKWRYSLYH